MNQRGTAINAIHLQHKCYLPINLARRHSVHVQYLNMGKIYLPRIHFMTATVNKRKCRADGIAGVHGDEDTQEDPQNEAEGDGHPQGHTDDLLTPVGRGQHPHPLLHSNGPWVVVITRWTNQRPHVQTSSSDDE